MKYLILFLMINLNICYAESNRYDAFEHINETKTFNVGARSDAIPFSFKNKSGDFDGFSIDIVKEIHRQLEIKFDSKIKLTFIEVTSANRISKIANHQIDIECGITIPSWERETLVDFSIPFFIDYVKLFTTNKDLILSKIGVLTGSTTIASISRAYPNIELVELPDMNTGMEKLRKGEIDGLSNIYILLKALIKNTKYENSAIFLPTQGGFSVSYLTCMIPENDSDWRDFVNKSISNMLIGVNEFRGVYVGIYDKWFGQHGFINHPIDSEMSKKLSPTMWFY